MDDLKWCVRQEPDPTGEYDIRYLGPFDTRDETIAAMDGDEDYAETILRCRPVKAPIPSAESVVDDLNADTSVFAEIADTWGNWDSDIAILRPGAQEALDEWAAKFIDVRAWTVIEDPTDG